MCGQEKMIVGYCGDIQSRMSALGFFVGSKIQIVKRNRHMLIVMVANTLYAIDMAFARRVIVR